MIECQLSDALTKDILNMTGHTQKDGVDNRSLKFDDRGTLHILGYDKEGKRIDDCALRNTNFTVVPEERTLEKSLLEQQALTEQSKALNKLANGILMILGIAVIGCIAITLRF